MRNTLSGIDENSLIKMIVVRGTGQGGRHTYAASDAPEIIQHMAVAIRAVSNKAVFDSTIGGNPTAVEDFVMLREAVTYAASNAGMK